jgi:hypothetical protein
VSLRAFLLSYILVFNGACVLASPASSPDLDLFRAYAKHEIAYVAEHGRADAKGSQDDPFDSIPNAAAHAFVRQIILLAGQYPDTKLTPQRALNIRGARPSKRESTEGKSVKLKLHIEGGIVALEDLHFDGGLSFHKLQNLAIQNVEIHCRHRNTACVKIKNSRVEARQLRLLAAKEIANVLLVESSTVQARQLSIEGGGFAQILARSHSRLELEDTQLTDAKQNALVLIGGSQLRWKGGEIRGAKVFDLLINRSAAKLENVRLAKTENISVGLQGGRLEARRCKIEASPKGGIHLLAHHDQLSQLVLQDSEIQHGSRQALLVNGGRALVRNSRFVGDPSTTGGEDAIMVWGATASVEIRGSRFEDAAGFALSFYEGGYGSVSATISRPRLGGILAASISSETIRIEKSRIEHCRLGNGITVLGGDSVMIEGVTVQSCLRSGILAGEGARVKVRNARLLKNRYFGLSAFGGAEIESWSLSVSGSAQNVFASCGEGSQIRQYRRKRISYSCP